uniref:Uncharacterized protein n=1 Tax=Rhizophora mucronata TaxID=61149 RepID=A0A2P2QCN4_RHIMU
MLLLKLFGALCWRDSLPNHVDFHLVVYVLSC